MSIPHDVGKTITPKHPPVTLTGGTESAGDGIQFDFFFFGWSENYTSRAAVKNPIGIFFYLSY
jgi:hypothetical protein